MAAPIDYFSEEHLRRDLTGKTVRGGAATIAAQVVLGVLQLATIPILARLLTPADFGLVAMVTVVTGFAAMLVDAGLSMATIQRDKISHAQVSNLFWLAVLSGAGIAIVVAALAPAIAWFYGEPRLIPITLALAASFVFSGATIQHRALLRRAMQFQRLTVTQVIAAAAGHIVAIYVAWEYQSYWALVWRPIVTAVVQFVGSWIACPWRPGLPRRGTGVRRLAFFGANLAGFNLINYISRNFDNVLIGWWWGATPLGYYDRAYRLLMFPLQQINLPIANVGIPALSRLQAEDEKYRRAYDAMVGKIIFITGAVVGFTIAVPELIIGVIYGPRWLPCVPIFRWLAVVAVRQIVNTIGWLFVSQGRSKELFMWGIIASVINIASFAIGLPWGPVGVAMSYAIIPTIVASPILFWMVGRRGPVSTSFLWKQFLYSLHVPLVVAAVVYAANRFIRFDSDLVQLVMLALLTLITGVSLMLATSYGRQNLREALKMLRHLKLSPKSPVPES